MIPRGNEGDRVQNNMKQDIDTYRDTSLGLSDLTENREFHGHKSENQTTCHFPQRERSVNQDKIKSM